MTTLSQPIPTTLDVSGQWRYRLDSADAGLEQGWYEDTFHEEDRLRLPGTTNENGVGEEPVFPAELNKETVRSLRQRHRYVGAVWYQREIRIPDDWSDKLATLFLERVMFESRVWIDGREAGMQDSLSVPHRFDVSGLLRPGGTHRLTIRVDNRDCRHIGPYPSAYTDETQTIWNGIVGRMELQASERIRLQDVQVYPDAAARTLLVNVKAENRTGTEAEADVKLSVRRGGSEAQSASFRLALTPSASQSFELEFALGNDCPLWDEFSPALHELTVSLEADGESRRLQDRRTVSFGMRTFAAEGTQFAVNGRRTFLRGTLDCCIYPLTGYPPMEEAPWDRIFRIVKDYGLNHVRFHSWCPPEAAFRAADRLGVYLQVEGPVWMDNWNLPVGSHPEHYRYLPEEAARIIDTYGNHPSFCLYSNGNELNGDFTLLHDIVVALKGRHPRPRQLFTLTANWDRPLDPADDYFIAQTVDGVGVRGQYFPDRLTDTTELEYGEAVAKRPVPVISHEVGQYTVYPNMDEIAKYTGCLKPTNLEAIRRDLTARRLLQDAPKFTEGSGKLAVQLYRDEIEAALRTPGMGGFQLLDLHDFPGQSTATVGILDAFWDSKGLIEPGEFRQFCGPTIVLLEMPKRIYTQKETWRAAIKISHYGAEDLADAEAVWSIRTAGGMTLDEGKLYISAVAQGSTVKLGDVSSDALAGAAAPEKLRVDVRVTGTDIANAWEIWVYPAYVSDAEAVSGEGGTIVARTLDKTTLAHLERGGSALLLPFESGREAANPGKFVPVFWSPVHFSSEDPCGIYAQAGHPAFRLFPTGAYASYPWKDLLDNSSSLSLDIIDADIQPIVQVVPNFYHNQRLANLFECRVGKGKALVCSIDLTSRLEARPAARQLRASLLDYMERETFMPDAELAPEQLRRLLQGRERAEDQARKLIGEELATGREAAASSEMSAGYSAGKGNDGIGHTLWRAADDQPGHWWQVDLGDVRHIAGTRVQFSHAAHYLYVIQVSDDGADWRVAVNQTGQTDSGQIRIDPFEERARFVRIVYNGLAPGVSAGHYSFEVYGGETNGQESGISGEPEP
ncbi:sugar-binding domain-containing protein [Cohnella zeiphila]|uniref:beta-galactosidase n=1 Tax=Cohnella zeiphila TaxID=2761120 RepID=A0A7X0SQF5_9BACL|nr:sugar-binding domain-containing protein [Cohnella zeiphila]MBB6734206.1 discoidin domain-containing protein [Cohnella zeiphila]